jgi:peroxiredoxin
MNVMCIKRDKPVLNHRDLWEAYNRMEVGDRLTVVHSEAMGYGLAEYPPSILFDKKCFAIIPDIDEEDFVIKKQNNKMKKLATTLILSLCVSICFAQKKDSVATDQTPILNILDISKVDSALQTKINRFELKDYNEILNMMRQVINFRVQAYNAANKSAAKKP